MRYRPQGQRYFDYAQTDQRLRSGLVGHWIGDGSGLTLRDRSGYGNHLSFVNSPKWSLGADNCCQALEYNGTDNYVSGVNNSYVDLGSGNFSIAARFKSNGSHIGVIYAKGDDASQGAVQLYLRTTDPYIRLLTQDASSSFTTSEGVNPHDGLWHDVVAIRIGTTLQIYLDNVLVSNNTGLTLRNTTNNGTINIGARIQSGVMIQSFSGKIEYVRLFKRALSQAEVLLTSQRLVQPVRMRRSMIIVNGVWVPWVSVY
jgi:hypothetical protein